MATYKYKTEEAHEKHKAYRREYYRKNRERIRARDNATARRNREKDPERFKEYARAFKARRELNPPEPKDVSLSTNPERELIQHEIMKERGELDA